MEGLNLTALTLYIPNLPNRKPLDHGQGNNKMVIAA
jgi:hypothetical protein